MSDSQPITIYLTGLDIQKFYRVALASPHETPANLVITAVHTLLKEHETPSAQESHHGIFVPSLGFNPIRFC